MSNAAPYSSIEKVFLVSRIPNIMVGTSFELLKATFHGVVHIIHCGAARAL